MMTPERAQQELENRRTSVNPRWKPGYHLSVPAGWLNDPNGFGFFAGKFHVFYQFHPYDSVWGPMHWGHWTSGDLVRWQDEPVAMAPDHSFDDAGCFSGTSIEKDGKFYLMYTGVQTAPQGKCYQQQCIAESADGVHFTKWQENPVIDQTMLPQGASIHEFRDPKVEKTAEGYRVILASQGKEGGQLLAYTSKDLHDWQFAGVYADHLGDMSECPDVFVLEGRNVLIVCEMGADPTVYGVPQCTLYTVGHEENGRLCAERPMQLVDQGLDFYAPQTMLTPDGRRVLIGWALSWGHVSPTHTLGHGWAGMMTLPRECTLDENGALCQKPVRELETLRSNEVYVKNLAVKTKTALEPLCGRQREFELSVDLQDAQTVELSLMETGDERLTVSYHRASETLRVDRSLCGYPLTPDFSPEQKPWCEAKVPLKEGRLDLHVFVDASIVEIYADGGRAVMSCLAFPKGEEYGVSVDADRQIGVCAAGWMMGNA